MSSKKTRTESDSMGEIEVADKCSIGVRKQNAPCTTLKSVTILCRGN